MKYIFILLLFISVNLFGQDKEHSFSLYFENDEYILTTTHKQLLDSVKNLPDKDLMDVHIKGYTNSIGTNEYNLALSLRRANSVKNYISEFTIISSIGYGELGSEDAANRRVDLFIHLKKDHIPGSDEIVEEPIGITANLKALMPPKPGNKVILEGIRFYPDRDVIMNESISPLKELVKFLKENPSINFKLIGHICCGDPMQPSRDHKNVRTGKYDLSEARAKALHNYLAKKGINTRRMRYIGLAYRQPTGKGNKFDRRVEIEITSINK